MDQSDERGGGGGGLVDKNGDRDDDDELSMQASMVEDEMSILEGLAGPELR